MRRRNFGDNPVNVAIVSIVAVIEAAQQALASAPDLRLHLPDWTLNANLNYVPLGLMILVGVIWLADRLVHWGQSDSSERIASPARSTAAAISPLIDRVFVDVTIGQLSAMCEGHTSAEVSRLTGPFIGKWLKITGTIRDITIHYAIIKVSLDSLDESGERHNSGLTFKRNWEDRLSVLPVGSSITAVGQIESIYRYGSVSLEKCELI